MRIKKRTYYRQLAAWLLLGVFISAFSARESHRVFAHQEEGHTTCAHHHHSTKKAEKPEGAYFSAEDQHREHCALCDFVFSTFSHDGAVLLLQPDVFPETPGNLYTAIFYNNDSGLTEPLRGPPAQA